MPNGRLILYFRKRPQPDRFIPGDRYIFSFLRKLLRGTRISGIEKVFLNLCRGLEKLEVHYLINIPFSKLEKTDRVIVLGDGKYSLEGYNRPDIPVIAGIGLMTHPAEWPTICTDYPVKKYLQHSEWTNNIYRPYFGDAVCTTWPAGIDTEKWKPSDKDSATFDVLIYTKFLWNKVQNGELIKAPIVEYLEQNGLTYQEIVYGSYNEKEYLDNLRNCKAMIYLCEHESQGFACCEALSMNVPVLAWDQGKWLDPGRLGWGESDVPATSIPFFDFRCGDRFTGIDQFYTKSDSFFNKVKTGSYSPREYILENLTLEKSAKGMLDILDSVYK